VVKRRTREKKERIARMKRELEETNNERGEKSGSLKK